MDGEETLELQFYSFIPKMVDNKVLLKEIRVTFNDLTDLTNLITFFIPISLHTVSKIGMYGYHIY